MGSEQHNISRPAWCAELKVKSSSRKEGWTSVPSLALLILIAHASNKDNYGGDHGAAVAAWITKVSSFVLSCRAQASGTDIARIDALFGNLVAMVAYHGLPNDGWKLRRVLVKINVIDFLKRTIRVYGGQVTPEELFQVQPEHERLWYHGTHAGHLEQILPPNMLTALNDDGDFGGATDSWNSFYVANNVEVALKCARDGAYEGGTTPVLLVFREPPNAEPTINFEAADLRWARYCLLSWCAAVPGQGRARAAQTLSAQYSIPTGMQSVRGPMTVYTSYAGTGMSFMTIERVLKDDNFVSNMTSAHADMVQWAVKRDPALASWQACLVAAFVMQLTVNEPQQ
jgi:hypothetical protein